MIKSVWLSVVRIVRQLVGKPESWLSDSGKGPIEQIGRMINVKTSIRGLSIRLDNGKVICWRINRNVAENAVRALQHGLLMVSDQNMQTLSDSGESVLSILQESDCFDVTYMGGIWEVELKENCSINHTAE